MDSDEINCFLKSKNQVKKKYSKKIYCYDTLPKQLKLGKFYIVNTLSIKSSFKIPGHWCIYLYYKNNILVFIDPFGTFPNAHFIYPMLRSGNKSTKYFYNNIQLQNYSTSTCAQHVVAIATLFSYNFSIKSIFLNFYQIKKITDWSPYKYDRIVNEFLFNFYGEKRSIFYEFT